jgi:hypothetical protein
LIDSDKKEKLLGGVDFVKAEKRIRIERNVRDVLDIDSWDFAICPTYKDVPIQNQKGYNARY